MREDRKATPHAHPISCLFVMAALSRNCHTVWQLNHVHTLAPCFGMQIQQTGTWKKFPNLKAQRADTEYFEENVQKILFYDSLKSLYSIFKMEGKMICVQ